MANINQPMFILRDDTDRFQGRTALRMNIMASQILAGIVRTTLGPKGEGNLESNGEGEQFE